MLLSFFIIIVIIFWMSVFMFWIFSPNETTRSLLILTSIVALFLLICDNHVPPTPQRQNIVKNSQVSTEVETETQLESEPSERFEVDISEVESSTTSSSEEISTSDTATSPQSSVVTVTETSSSATSVEQSSASVISDTRPENDERSSYSYAYQPPHAVDSGQTVYVNSTIPGRYHLDPNCRGLNRYGGGTAMSLEEAKAQGYVAECTYERYGS